MGQLVSGGGQTSPSSHLSKNAAYVVGLHHAGLRPLCWPHTPRTARPLHITYRRISFIKQEPGSTERCQGHTEHMRMRTWEHAGRKRSGSPFLLCFSPRHFCVGPEHEVGLGKERHSASRHHTTEAPLPSFWPPQKLSQLRVLPSTAVRHQDT